MPNRDGVYELVRTLNSSLGEHALREKVLEQVFDTYWPQFEEKFQLALTDNPAGEHIPARSEESILSEVLRTIRSLDRRVRTMERSSDVIDMERERKHRFMSPGALRREIRNLLEQGLPPEIIEEILEGKGPSRAIKEFARDIAREMEEEDSNDVSEG